MSAGRARRVSTGTTGKIIAWRPPPFPHLNPCVTRWELGRAGLKTPTERPYPLPLDQNGRRGMEHVVIHRYIGHPDQPSHGSYVDICITRCCHIFLVAPLCCSCSQGDDQASQEYLRYFGIATQALPGLASSLRDLRRVRAFRVANSGLASSLARASS